MTQDHLNALDTIRADKIRVFGKCSNATAGMDLELRSLIDSLNQLHQSSGDASWPVGQTPTPKFWSQTPGLHIHHAKYTHCLCWILLCEWGGGGKCGDAWTSGRLCVTSWGCGQGQQLVSGGMGINKGGWQQAWIDYNGPLPPGVCPQHTNVQQIEWTDCAIQINDS